MCYNPAIMAVHRGAYRYYDYALMGGWVYEKEVKPRAKEASPLSPRTQLR